MESSLSITSDEYDPVTRYHWLEYENRRLKGSGDDFQRLFEDIIKRAKPEFMRIRPYGKIGDRKCDGLFYVKSPFVIFQVYSPDEIKQSKLRQKIDEDLDGAIEHWGDSLKEWFFVYNVRRGLPPDLPLTLQAKQKQYPNIKIKHLSNDDLWEMASNQLSLEQRNEILGLPPSIQSNRILVKPSREEACHFLEETEKRFNSTYVFHVRQSISLGDQYIPIQVMPEHKRKDIENSWGYIDSGVNLKQPYALKGSGDQSRQTPVDWTQVRNQCSRLIVLADPGMGKTTLLNQEVCSATQGALEKLRNNQADVKEAIIPLFVRLPDLAKTAGELFDAIPDLIQRDYQQLAIPALSLLQEKLKNGTCCLFLDALDEVPRDHRKDLIEKLDRFAQNSSCAMTVTSRIVGYNGELRHFVQEVEIVPFNEKQRNQYIKTWFRNAANYLEDKSVTPEKLIRELEDKPQIAGLAQNPLLLSLICSLYQTKGLTLPTRRSQVYEYAVEFILGKWRHQRKLITEGKIRAKMRFLEHLAYQFSSNEQDVFSADELYCRIEKYLQNDKVPTVLKNVSADDLFTELSEEDGIIQKLEREGNGYIFLHLTFQEYFTAKYFASWEDHQASIQDLVENHLTETHFREVFLLSVELLSRNKTNALLQTMKKQIDKILALDKNLQNFLKWVARKTRSVDTPYKSVAVRAFYTWNFDFLYFLDRHLSQDLACDYEYSIDPDVEREYDSWMEQLRLEEMYSDYSSSAEPDNISTAVSSSNIQPNLDWNLAIDLALINLLDLSFDNVHAENIDSDLNTVVAFIVDLPLKEKLQVLQAQIEVFVMKGWEPWEEWWQINGQDWLKQLKLVMIEYRDVGHDWQFDDGQKRLLKQYYGANKLLIDCLDAAQETGNIELTLKEEIEKELLLPIEEIEKRRNSCRQN